MKFVEDALTMASIVREWRKKDKSIGFVPTMGWFHEGHLSLMKASLIKTDKTVVSLFVNPRQFGPHEDLGNYPRDHQRDSNLAEEIGVDVLFLPTIESMYPEGYQTNISVQKLSLGLCGASRPVHFDGVATIVTKLFNLVQPDVAIFGEKDYQQLALIRQLTKDLNFNIEIIGHPIVREYDGLAMSSRNKYLDKHERENALCLFQTIQYAKKVVGKSEKEVSSKALINELSTIIQAAPGCEVDYVSIVDKITLNPTENAERGNILALAVFVNKKVRLIDNTLL